MILVTLGTQDKPFTRLLENIEDQINKGNIKERAYICMFALSFSPYRVGVNLKYQRHR